MRRENPRTFRLSLEALNDLAYLEEESGSKAAPIIEGLITREAQAKRAAPDPEARLSGIEAQLSDVLETLTEISDRLTKLEKPDGP